MWLAGRVWSCLRTNAVGTAKQNHQALAPLLEIAAGLRTGAQRDALAAYVIRRLHTAWKTR